MFKTATKDIFNFYFEILNKTKSPCRICRLPKGLSKSDTIFVQFQLELRSKAIRPQLNIKLSRLSSNHTSWFWGIGPLIVSYQRRFLWSDKIRFGLIFDPISVELSQNQVKIQSHHSKVIVSGYKMIVRIWRTWSATCTIFLHSVNLVFESLSLGRALYTRS